MAKGRSIRLYLVDGTPTGLITAEIVNWTGHVILAPRSRLSDLLQRKEPSRTGIYFLFGQDPDNSVQTMLYIGESENVGRRLAQHNKDTEKSFWERVCLVTSKDQNITKGHGKYLESRLIEIAKDAGRTRMVNGTAPEYGGLPEADLADMEFFLDQIRVILPVLGIDFLRDTILARSPDLSVVLREQVSTPVNRPVSEVGAPAAIQPNDTSAAPHAPTVEEVIALSTSIAEGRASYPRVRPSAGGNDSPVFEIRDTKSSIVARAREIAGEMVVLAGSHARVAEGDSLTSSQRQLRESLKSTGALISDPSHSDRYIFAADVPFSSPSQASGIVYGRSDNGRSSWKTIDDGISYQRWQEEQISKLAESSAE